MRPGFTLDSTHLLVGWRWDGWKGPHLQWEFGAYVNLDLFMGEGRMYRLTYNYPEWRHHVGMMTRMDRTPLPRFEFSR